MHELQPLHVDGVVAVQIDGGADATHQIVRMRVLAAEHGVDLDDFLLPLEGFQIMRHRHEIRLRRQLVGRMAPISVLENSKLAGLDEFLQRAGDIGVITRRRRRPVRRHLLGERRGGCGIGLERRYHVHPIQRMQVIEVNHMVLDILRQLHDVADDFRIFRNGDVQCVLHRSHRRQRMHRGAYSANALAERPGIARVAALKNYFQAAPHGA